MVFGSANQLKKSLAESKIYDKAATSIIDNAAKDSANEPDSPFSQPAVQDAAKKALSPTFVQNTSEQILDGMYGWLQQKTPQPQFNIDVSAVKQQFTSAVGDYAVSRAQQLPACTALQARQLGSDIDPLTLSCVPAGFNIETLRAKIAADLDKQQGEGDNLLQQSTISPESLPKDENGKSPVQSFSENAERAPKLFKLVTLAPWLLAAVAIVSGALYVLLHDEKRRGIRGLATTLLVIGLLTLLGIMLTNSAFGRLERSDALVNTDANIKEPLTALVRSLSGAVNQKLMLFGAGYTVLGAAALVGLHLTKPKHPGISDDVEDKPEKKADQPVGGDEPKKQPDNKPAA